MVIRDDDDYCDNLDDVSSISATIVTDVLGIIKTLAPVIFALFGQHHKSFLTLYITQVIVLVEAVLTRVSH